MLNQIRIPVALAIGSLDAETIRLAWQTPLIGMGMIFAVLAILWGVLAIFKLIFVGKDSKTPKQPKCKTPKQADTKPSDDAISPVITAEIQSYQEDQARNDMALVAILTAAVAAYREEEGAQGEFRVVSFKRASSRAWNAKK